MSRSSITDLVFKKQHYNGPIVEFCSGPQFKICILNNFKINITSISNCYVGYTDQNKLNICKVENICKNSSKNVVLIVKNFENIKPFFEKPINRLS